MTTLKIITIFVLFCFLGKPSIAKQGFGPGDQEWGYMTVRPKAHMFWWLYHTTADVNLNKYEEKPLVIWVQGGPGVSGTGFGNFEELGPLDSNLKPRNHTWIKDYNVLFIDNPVGTGFSYVDSLDVLSQTNEQIAEDLTECIKAFFQQFPKFSKTPTYILAESYGGKMTVEWANVWYQEQAKGNIKSNLKGIGLINSLISADTMYKSWAPFLFYIGMIDSDGYKAIEHTADKFMNASRVGDWLKAVTISNEMEYLIQNFTYHIDRYNVLKKVNPVYHMKRNESVEVTNLLYSKELKEVMKNVKTTLGLESTWGEQESAVARALTVDSRKPVVYQVEKLLNETNIKVYIFNGQLDVILNTSGQLKWVKNLKWKHSQDWLSATRWPLVVDDIIEGYSKGYGNLKFYWVNRSGHMVPAENPVAMEAALKELIYN